MDERWPRNVSTTTVTYDSTWKTTLYHSISGILNVIQSDNYNLIRNSNYSLISLKKKTKNDF